MFLSLVLCLDTDNYINIHKYNVLVDRCVLLELEPAAVLPV